MNADGTSTQLEDYYEINGTRMSESEYNDWEKRKSE
jgi:hypothetical protein